MTIQNDIIEEVFPKTLEILSELIKFQTVSGTSNVELIEYKKKLNFCIIFNCRITLAWEFNWFFTIWRLGTTTRFN